MDLLDSYQLQLELAYRELIAMELIGELSDQQEPTLGLVREALSIVQSILERNDQDIQRGYQASVVHEGSIGRPRFDVPRNQLACLLEKRFTVPQIADIIGVSIRTVRRRMTEYQLSIHALYSQLTDQQLDGIVRDIQT